MLAINKVTVFSVLFSVAPMAYISKVMFPSWHIRAISRGDERGKERGQDAGHYFLNVYLYLAQRQT
jgi:hypothetical protein